MRANWPHSRRPGQGAHTISAVQVCPPRREARLRPCPARKAVGHRAGDEVARHARGPRSLACGSGFNPGGRSSCRSRPARISAHAVRDTCRRNPSDPPGDVPPSSSAAGHNPKRNMSACRLVRRVRPDVGADRGAGGRADRRHPARIARCAAILGRLIHGEGVAGGDERKRVVGGSIRATETSSATPPRCAATRLASAVPMPLPISV